MIPIDTTYQRLIHAAQQEHAPGSAGAQEYQDAMRDAMDNFYNTPSDHLFEPLAEIISITPTYDFDLDQELLCYAETHANNFKMLKNMMRNGFSEVPDSYFILHLEQINYYLEINIASYKKGFSRDLNGILKQFDSYFIFWQFIPNRLKEIEKGKKKQIFNRFSDCYLESPELNAGITRIVEEDLDLSLEVHLQKHLSMAKELTDLFDELGLVHHLFQLHRDPESIIKEILHLT